MEQVSLFDDNAEYDAFVEKFKPKKTTDDCYTPDEVYDAIAGWVCSEYGVTPDKFVRPFWPGGDFESFDYPEDCVVVDNPPFSILAKIRKYYLQHGIRYFLFAPSLTCLSGGIKDSAVISDSDITYANGAVVLTAFVTNLDTCVIRTAPELYRRVKAANDKVQKALHKQLPKYIYPDYVVTAAIVQRYAAHNIDFRLERDDCTFIRALDDQRAHGKGIFGGGYLLSERAAAERAKAELMATGIEGDDCIQWEISDRERAIIATLGKENTHEH